MKTNRNGFTLVEVVIAMMLLSIILTMLAGVAYYSAQTAVDATDMMTANGYSTETMNRLTALPYDSLPNAVGCDTVGTTNARFSRCVAISASTTTSSTLSLTTTGLQRNEISLSMSLIRAAPPGANPLCMSGGC